MKRILIILIVIVVIVAGLGIMKDLIFKYAIEAGVKAATGAELKISFFHISLLKQVVSARGVELLNPASFKDRVMAIVPEIYVDADLRAALNGRIHMQEVRIDLAKFVVVRNAGGSLNVDALKVVQTSKKEGAARAGTPGRGPGKMPPFMIDDLSLKIGKAVYIDYSGGGAPRVMEYNINMNERFQNIDDLSKLVGIVIARVMMSTPIGRLANFDVSGLTGSLADTLSTATTIANNLAGSASGEAVKAASTATRQAADTVESAANALLGAFGGGKK